MSRRGYFLVMYLAVLFVGVVSFISVTPRLLWNASASVPIGLYDLDPPGRPDVGDLVAVMPPKPLADFMVARGYIGRNVPLLKRVMGLPGQHVCRQGRTITLDGIKIGEALGHDGHGRDLPVWQGCRRIAGGDLFLMNPDAPDSMDGRYFGPLPARAVIARATPLYTDEAGDGRYVWRAATR